MYLPEYPDPWVALGHLSKQGVSSSPGGVQGGQTHLQGMCQGICHGMSGYMSWYVRECQGIRHGMSGYMSGYVWVYVSSNPGGVQSGKTHLSNTNSRGIIPFHGCQPQHEAHVYTNIKYRSWSKVIPDSLSSRHFTLTIILNNPQSTHELMPTPML